ncbi:MAG: hemerythrin domain-containing protein [Coriobacteriales bacterium]|nr:hemerythrin domain-containing protein [Coriobacteriales bacterium]
METTWDPSMETGHEEIDRQHREIIGLIDELRVVEQADEVPAIAGALVHVMDLTVVHFRMEEDLMGEVDYPAHLQREMIDQHDEFKSYARLRVIEFSAANSTAIEPLGSFIRTWLVGHEFGLDRKLVDWIRGQELAG